VAHRPKEIGMNKDNRVGLVLGAGIGAGAAAVAKGFRDLQKALNGELGDETREFAEGFLLWCRDGCPEDDLSNDAYREICFDIAEDALSRAAQSAYTVATLIVEEMGE
jgi:hypothetical protein